MPSQERKKKVYKLGDEVKIKVLKVDTDAHEIFFTISKEDKEKPVDVEEQ